MKPSLRGSTSSGGGGASTSSNSKEDKDANVPTLLASLRKHKNFKQMLTYSLNCLDKIVKPPRLGWEVRRWPVLLESLPLRRRGSGRTSKGCLLGVPLAPFPSSPPFLRHLYLALLKRH